MTPCPRSNPCNFRRATFLDFIAEGLWAFPEAPQAQNVISVALGAAPIPTSGGVFSYQGASIPPNSGLKMWVWIISTGFSLQIPDPAPLGLSMPDPVQLVPISWLGDHFTNFGQFSSHR